MSKEKEEIRRYEAVEKFLSVIKSKNTRRTYRTALNKYFDHIEKNPDTYFDNKEDRYDEYVTDMHSFIKMMLDEKKAPLSIRLSFTAVRRFLRKHRMEFEGVELDEFKLLYAGGSTIDKNKILSSADLKIILSGADTRLKALYLFMLSSGMRRGELSQLKIKDVDMTYHPTKVGIKEEYTKASKGKQERRTTFISDEATYYLKEWLKIRGKHLKAVYERLDGQKEIIKKPGDDTIFPMDSSAIEDSFIRLLNKAGTPYDEQDEHTKRHTYTCHGLRKFFRSQLPEAVPIDYVEVLMGHSGYLTKQYRDFSDKKLAEQYLKGMHTLTIFETGISKSELDRKEEKIKEQKEQLEKYEDLQHRIELIERLNKDDDVKGRI